jgi:PAS domain S-box-containing protein
MNSDESADRFQRFLELSPFVGWITDAEGRFIELSPRWTELTGMSREDTFAYGWISIVHPDERDALVGAWHCSLATGEALDQTFRLKVAGGNYEWARSRAYSDNQGGAARWYGVTENVNDRARAESGLRELADAMPQLVWTASPDGQVDYYNARRSTFAGLENGGDPLEWAPFVHPDDLQRTIEAWSQALKEGETYVCEHRLKCANGNWTWHLSRALPVRDEAGAITRWYGTATDVDALKVADAHRELLVKELDHRLKNTLQIVQALVRQSLRSAADLDAAQSAIEERLMALASAHTLLTGGQWSALELRKIVTEALQGHAETNAVIDGPTLALAPQTAVAFTMALHELMTNAVKYGALSVETGRIEVRWRLDDAMLRFEWRECDGPLVTAPSRRGFGSMMLERALASELSGTVTLEFEPSGLVCRIEAPLPA